MPSHPEVLAVYFPSYHPDAHYARWYGPSWSEWELVKAGRPLFPGHLQPFESVWGCFDESDPAWMARQIDLLADHGVTGFLFDWYWYQGEQFLEAALERGFLQAPNRQRLKFCLMWANHTWGVFPATRELYRGERRLLALTARNGPAPGAAEGQALAYDGTLLPITHSAADTERVATYCCEHYFHEPNYLRIDGKPVFTFFYHHEIAASMGGWPGVAEAFRILRDTARRHGEPGLYLAINIACREGGVHCWHPEDIPALKAAGADSVFGYNATRTRGFGALTNARPVVRSNDVIASHRELFALSTGRGLPFHPVATVGFDNTTRWHRGASLPVDFRKLGYEPIVVGNTPEKFRLTVRTALECIRAQARPELFLLVNALNEWTEGNVLLPTRQWGTGYLDALVLELC